MADDLEVRFIMEVVWEEGHGAAVHLRGDLLEVSAAAGAPLAAAAQAVVGRDKFINLCLANKVNIVNIITR